MIPDILIIVVGMISMISHPGSLMLNNSQAVSFGFCMPLLAI